MDTRYSLAFLKTLFRDLNPTEQIEMRGIDMVNPGGSTSRKYNTPEDALAFIQKFSDEFDIYVGVAPRISGVAGGGKDAVSSVGWVWADIDAGNPKADTYLCLPPTMTVCSGSGRHVYWRLNRRITGDEAEKINTLMARVFGADNAAKDYARILRVPGADPASDGLKLLNRKPVREGSEPLPVYVIENQTDLSAVYDPADITAFLNVLACEIPLKKLTGAHTGDQTNVFVTRNLRYPGKLKSPMDGKTSRSTMVWHVVKALVSSDAAGGATCIDGTGCSNAFIVGLFERLPIGERTDKDKDEIATLKNHTLKAVRLEVSDEKAKSSSAFTAKDDGLYFMGERVSSFTLEPTAVLRATDGEDTLICTVRSEHRTYPGQPFPRSVFMSTRDMNESRNLPNASCVWFDTRDSILRLYCEELWQYVVMAGIQEKPATPLAGRHGKTWVTATQVIGPDGPISVDDAPLVYLPGVLDAPATHYDFETDPGDLFLQVSRLMPQLNSPYVLWPVLGWFMATPFAPIFRDQPEKPGFPTLLVYGHAESGKSTLVKRVMLRLMGYVKPSAEPASTISSWATIAKLSGNVSIPVVLDELRINEMEENTSRKLLSDVRSAYDRDVVTRGKRSLRVEQFPLTAPLCLVGEDLIEDTATKDRLIVVNPQPRTIMDRGSTQETDAHKAYSELSKLPLQLFAGHYIKWCLTHTPDWDAARQVVDLAFPMSIGERLRDNLTTCVCGLWAYNNFLREIGGHTVPVDVAFVREYFKPSVREVANIEGGYKGNALDPFIVDLALEIASGRTGSFAHSYDPIDDILAFNLSSAYAWWQQAMTRRGKKVPWSNKIISKLIAERTVPPNEEPAPGQVFRPCRTMRVSSGASQHCHILDIKLAIACGLDIPDKLPVEVSNIIDFSRSMTTNLPTNVEKRKEAK